MELLTRPWCLDHMTDWLLAEGPPGSVVEVGVFEGGSLCYLAGRLPGRRLFGYDTFAGLVGATERDTTHKDGDFVCGEGAARWNLRAFNNVTLIPGVYPESDRDPPAPVALAHIDVDLYRPTLAALLHVWPLLAPGGRVYAGDVHWDGTPGATLAWDEFCRETGAVPQKAYAPEGVKKTWYDHPEPAPLAFAEKR